MGAFICKIKYSQNKVGPTCKVFTVPVLGKHTRKNSSKPGGVVITSDDSFKKRKRKGKKFQKLVLLPPLKNKARYVMSELLRNLRAAQRWRC